MTFNLWEDYEALGDTLIPKILPNGKYTAVVKRAVAGTTNNGKGKIVVTLEVVEGPEAGSEVVEQLTWSPESDTAARIMSGALAVMGATPEWVRENRADLSDVADYVIGSLVEISTKEDEWNGQPRNRVSFLKNLGQSAGSAKAQQEQAVDLAASAPIVATAAPAAMTAAPAPADAAGGWPTL